MRRSRSSRSCPTRSGPRAGSARPADSATMGWATMGWATMGSATMVSRAQEADVPLFRRGRGDALDEDLVEGSDDAARAADHAADDRAAGDRPADDEAGLPTEPGRPAPPGRPAGPWDADDVDEDGVERLDLGALLVPVPDGCEVRVDVQDEQGVAATVVDGRSALQIHGFAAPRSEGIWDEVRQEIADSLRQGGGSADESDGPFGRELRARIPTAEPGPGQMQGQQLQPARFIGVDGPRWFLRGLMTGAGSTDPNQARTLEEVFRGVVVVRGGEAMAPRDLLPLRLPREALAQMAAEQEDQEPAKPTLDMLERGPEITETR